MLSADLLQASHDIKLNPETKKNKYNLYEKKRKGKKCTKKQEEIELYTA